MYNVHVGDWKPTQIDNPDYQGEWVHPKIPNPEYEADEFLYRYEDFGVIGLDLWQVSALSSSLPPLSLSLFSFILLSQFSSHPRFMQVKSGTIFDNFLITDDEKYAEEFGDETWGQTKDAEKKMKDEQDEEERKKAEEAAKAMEEEEEEEEEEGEDEDFDTEEVS